MLKNLIILCLTIFPLLVCAQQLQTQPQIGIAENFENDGLLKTFGYKCLTESIAKLFSPKQVSDEQFQKNLPVLRTLDIPIYTGYLFIPGELKVVGPKVDEGAILQYVEIVFQRCKAAGVKMITWGSGGSRRVPDNFDPSQAKRQFISIARKISVLAKKYDIILALENLNSSETNFITTLKEALEIADAVNNSNFKVCVDIYHMLKEGESAAVIEGGKNFIVHCDIAEKENRAAPGVTGEDFRPYLKALRKIGFSGKIIVECRWESLTEQGAAAYQYLQQQIDEAYSE